GDERERREESERPPHRRLLSLGSRPRSYARSAFPAGRPPLAYRVSLGSASCTVTSRVVPARTATSTGFERGGRRRGADSGRGRAWYWGEGGTARTRAVPSGSPSTATVPSSAAGAEPENSRACAHGSAPAARRSAPDGGTRTPTRAPRAGRPSTPTTRTTRR